MLAKARFFVEFIRVKIEQLFLAKSAARIVIRRSEIRKIIHEKWETGILFNSTR